MKRSELIKTLQETTDGYGRDGEIEVYLFDDADQDPVVMTILATNVAAGSGDAISIIEVGRPIKNEIRQLESELASMGVDPDRLVTTVMSKIEALKHWTTQPPTEPGWYWFAPYEGPVEVVEVGRVMADRDLSVFFGGVGSPLSETDGTWFSEPLSVPGPNGGK